MITTPMAQLTHRIVVGVSPTDSSDAVLRWAIEYASVTGAYVEAVHAFTLPPMTPYSGAHGAAIRQISDLVTAGERCKLERRIEPFLDEMDVSVSITASEGTPGYALAHAVHEVDLLVVGVRQNGFIASLRTGFSNQALAQRSSCPVVLVPD